MAEKLFDIETQKFSVQKIMSLSINAFIKSNDMTQIKYTIKYIGHIIPTLVTTHTSHKTTL